MIDKRTTLSLAASFVTLLVTLLVTRGALAQTAQPAPAASSARELVDSLVKQVDDQAEAFEAQIIEGLESSQCVIACKALESMRGAADSICRLEPGPRCDRARAKVEAARQKVLAACPDCEAATDDRSAVTPPSPENRPVPSTKPEGGADTDGEPGPPSPAPPPQASPSEGGCAPCTVGAADRGSESATLLVLLGLALAGRRRRRS